MAIIEPVINGNGMTADEHIRNRIKARQAIKHAIEALAELRPHGRDYQTLPNNDRYSVDTGIHTARIRFLDQLYNDLMDEAVAIQEQKKS